jgi:hypothetical protein
MIDSPSDASNCSSEPEEEVHADAPEEPEVLLEVLLLVVHCAIVLLLTREISGATVRSWFYTLLRLTISCIESYANIGVTRMRTRSNGHVMCHHWQCTKSIEKNISDTVNEDLVLTGSVRTQCPLFFDRMTPEATRWLGAGQARERRLSVSLGSARTPDMNNSSYTWETAVFGCEDRVLEGSAER